MTVGAALFGLLLGQASAARGDLQQAAAPLEVTFTTPGEGEADVRLDAVIRIQFSRHVDEDSLTGRVKLSYSASQSAERGEAQPPELAFALKYDPGTHAITITPTNRLERFRDVQVALSKGIVSADGAALRPWTLRFSTGGSAVQ